MRGMTMNKQSNNNGFIVDFLKVGSNKSVQSGCVFVDSSWEKQKTNLATNNELF